MVHVVTVDGLASHASPSTHASPSDVNVEAQMEEESDPIQGRPKRTHVIPARYGD